MQQKSREQLQQEIRQLEIILHLGTALKKVAIIGSKVAGGEMSNERGWEAISVIVSETAEDIPEIK